MSVSFISFNSLDLLPLIDGVMSRELISVGCLLPFYPVFVRLIHLILSARFKTHQGLFCLFLVFFDFLIVGSAAEGRFLQPSYSLLRKVL